MKDRKKGASLVEILIALALLSGAMMTVMTFFLNTSSRYVRSEAYVQSAVLAQMVIERFRSQLEMNPELLENMQIRPGQPWRIVGGVVDPARSTGGTRTLLPLFSHLFAKDDQGLYAASNEVSITGGGTLPADSSLAREMENLLREYRDYQVEITVEDDVDPETAGASPLAEMVKLVRVTASRASVAAERGQDPQAFTMTARILTPFESLSPATQQRLGANFDQDDLAQAQSEFFTAVAGNPYFAMLTPTSRQLLADCYLILGYLNTELYLTGDASQGVMQNLMFTEPPQRTVQQWIDELSQPAYSQLAVFRKEKVKLLAMKLELIFDAWKKILPVLENMHTLYQEKGASLAQMTDILEAAENDITALNSATAGYIQGYRAAETDRTQAQQALAAHEQSQPPQPIQDEYDQDEQAWQQWEQQRQALVAEIVAAEGRMTQNIQGMDGRMDTYATSMTQHRDRMLQFYDLITVLKFVHDFFNDSEPADGDRGLVMDQLLQYPTRFDLTSRQLEESLVMHMEGDATVLPMERAMSMQRYAEVVKIRRLAGFNETSSLARLTAVGQTQDGIQRVLADYLARGLVHDPTRLGERNTGFRDKVRKLIPRPDAAATTPDMVARFRGIRNDFAEGGSMRQFLHRYRRIVAEVRLEGEGELSRILDSIRDARGVMDYVTNATRAEIVAAMQGVRGNGNGNNGNGHGNGGGHDGGGHGN